MPAPAECAADYSTGGTVMSTQRIGIIGAGQLSLYLCEAAEHLGLRVSVLSEKEDAPALTRADQAMVAPLDDAEALEQLIAASDVITFDKEDIPEKTLAVLEEAVAGGRIFCEPSPQTLRLIKDKGLQKEWLQSSGLPTLPFITLSGHDTDVTSVPQSFQAAVVQKARQGGFDGRGVQILNTSDWRSQLWDTPSLLEPYLPDTREVSVIIARDRDGAVQSYPPVSMEFDPELNSVKIVSMPATMDEQLAREAVHLAERSVEALQGVGVFAVEMFITSEGELLINEISPRVHNSGHLTLDACNVSQFEQHLRAIAGLPLVPVETDVAAVMLNILYTEDLRHQCPSAPLSVRSGEHAAVYWYGKLPGNVGRKMGHINATAPGLEEAITYADRAMAALTDPDGERAA